MKKNKNYSVFNNFNKNYNYLKEPNYFDEYENEFSEELFQRLYQGVENTAKRAKKDETVGNSPRNGESDDN